MENLQKRYDFLVREHKRIHEQIEYMEKDSSSNEAISKAKQRKLAIKDEMNQCLIELSNIKE